MDMGKKHPGPPAPRDVQGILEAIDRDLGNDALRWFVPDGYASVALAVLDAIYSTGNHYTGVRALVRTYMVLRTAEGADPAQDTATDLVEAFTRWDGVEGFVDRTGYRWRTSARKSSPYKAHAALEAAKALAAAGVATVDDARRALADRQVREQSDLARDWAAIAGQRSGLTWNYFLMLVGIPGIKADRMVTRYAASALGRAVGQAEASALLEAAADGRGWVYTTLDHAIWRFQSGRPYLRPVD